jgi:glyceraldehyde 3-phosphate dehydrogenase
MANKRVAINGFGRIGRLTFRAFLESGREDLDFVAINDLGSAEMNAHLLEFDSVHGRFRGRINVTGGHLKTNGHDVAVLSEATPEKLPWRDLGVDIVMECTGRFTDREGAAKHLTAGAKRVLVSAPCSGADLTVVFGVNDDKLTQEHHVVSNASCTTNGVAPAVKVLLDNFGIIKGQMTTIHAYTNSQRLLDMQSKDLREARAAAMNIVPLSTGAARALKLVIPEIEGKLDGVAYRVPTPTVSIVEVVCLVEKATTAEAVNEAMRKAAAGAMKGILAVTDEPLVSMDLKGDAHSSTVDALITNVVAGDLVKVAAWYDNEWGYSCRTSDLCSFMTRKGL